MRKSMRPHWRQWGRPLALGGLSLMLAACASGPATTAGPTALAPPMAAPNGSSPALANTPEAQYRLLNRLTWGANSSSATDIARLGSARYLEQQLHPSAQGALPAPVQAYVDGLTISSKPLEQLVADMEQMRKDADAVKDDDAKKAAQQAYQKELNRLNSEAANRFAARALYSRNQLQEQMVWFWFNHFNVHSGKHNLRLAMGDYEQNAIRAHALGKFKDLLMATVYHPAMLAYLDNNQNAAGHINENYARELMELHTLGVNGGYSQKDVQELAKVLTGMGINQGRDTPKLRPGLESQYLRKGVFEFNPQRHDYTDKVLLGHTIKGRGIQEVNEAVDLLARQPATAQFVCQKLAQYFVADEPSPALVQRLAQVFASSDGDMATVLKALFESDEFARSLGKKFKDPVHYVMSSIRLAYDDKVVLNPNPVGGWLYRLGEPLYGHATPDGYSLASPAWSSSGQMTTRFEIAKNLGGGSSGLFKTDGPAPREAAAFPQLSNALYFQAIRAGLSDGTRQALDQAASPQEWNMLLLASPEFMNR